MANTPVAGAFPIETRLKIGAISLAELVGLSNRSRHSLEVDIRAGKLKVRKIGDGDQGAVLIAGPEAQRYLGLAVDV